MVKRAPELVRLSWDHHHGLVFALRLARELPAASDEAVEHLYSDLLAFWSAGLLPHFRAEGECLLARLIRYVPPEDETVVRTATDHLYMEALVATMRDEDSPGVRRDALQRFGQTLQAHIRWEESVLFELTQEQLAPADLAALGRELARELPPLAPVPSGA